MDLNCNDGRPRRLHSENGNCVIPGILSSSQALSKEGGRALGFNDSIKGAGIETATNMRLDHSSMLLAGGKNANTFIFNASTPLGESVICKKAGKSKTHLVSSKRRDSPTSLWGPRFENL